MATPDDCAENPRLDQPNAPGSPLAPACDPSASLIESLGSLVDDARQIAVDLGARPYRVFSVHVRWTGGEVGRGEAVRVQEREFLPTPYLDETSGVRGELRSGGLVERGTIRLRQISPRYTEDQVRGLCCCSLVGPDGLPDPAMEGWIEVRVDSRDGLTTRRRFVVTGQPYRNAERSIEWTASLLRQDQDSTRAGDPYAYTNTPEHP